MSSLESRKHRNMRPNPSELLRQTTLAIGGGLSAAYAAWHSLSPQEGLSKAHANRFEETARHADIESERAMMRALSSLPSNIRWHWISEELGEHWSTPATIADITLVADGIDGTSNAVKDWGKGRYGAMIGAAAGSNPTYGDYLTGGIALFTEGVYVQGIKGQGACIVNVTSNEKMRIHTSKETELRNDSLGFAEENLNVKPTDPLYDFFMRTSALAAKLQQGGLYRAHPSGSTAANAYEVAIGRALFDVSATRKGNLEQLAIKALVEEAGGVMYALEPDSQGQLSFVSLDDKEFLTYGQDEHIPLVTAANQAIADQLLDRLT